MLRCHDAPVPMAVPLLLLALGSLFVGYLAKVGPASPLVSTVTKRLVLKQYDHTRSQFNILPNMVIRVDKN
jgi:NADH:ubiquinone oxidoreductase subunit 5 (subunit L)/multisubunit Na+/H+ antiporter MnhA subunit